MKHLPKFGCLFQVAVDKLVLLDFSLVVLVLRAQFAICCRLAPGSCVAFGFSFVCVSLVQTLLVCIALLISICIAGSLACPIGVLVLSALGWFGHQQTCEHWYGCWLAQ